VSGSAADRRIRSLRPPKPKVDPYKAHGSVIDEERRPGATIERALTVFLAGAECPFTCSFCDLWQWTIDGATPNGALVRQLEDVLGTLGEPSPDRLKLYNASNFFDRRAVPIADHAAIAALAAPFTGITVESHARGIGPDVVDFARRLNGRLEVAIGLETVHADAMAHLNKRLDFDRFDRAADDLAAHDIDLRVFVLLGTPYVRAEESVEWTMRSVEYALARGAAVVSIIPVRGGNGELERLASLGHFTSPTLTELESALDQCLFLGPGVVTADCWDAERLAACDTCRPARLQRLRRLNVSGRSEPRVACAECAS